MISHLLKLSDLEKEDIVAILDRADALKKETKAGIPHPLLMGKTLGMIFQKSSTRTRVSFEVGMYQLGGHALFLSARDIQLGRGETIADTAKVLSRYVNGIMIRTDLHQKVIDLAREADIPVINGLTDSSHPCQALTDFFTIFEREKKLEGVKLAYLGDGNNVANSLLLCAATLGVDISIACPARYMPDSSVIDRAKKLARSSGSAITITPDIDEAVKGAGYIYTDVWTSMGQEKEYMKRKKIFARYRITREVLKKCAPGCKVMHWLPAHRGAEIDADVIDSDDSIVFDQAENRLHVQKALMCALMGK
jgi:ornithine carbamoyltransferase